MHQYLDLIKNVLHYGVEREDRTGTGTISVFGRQMRFNLEDGFPLVTTKRLNTKAIIHELLWFLKGDTNVHYLNKNGVRIWDPWANQDGDLGPIYGSQWTSWGSHHSQDPSAAGVDQIQNVVDLIKDDPSSRRMIISAWNVTDLDEMALPPCHCLFQFYVSEGKLSCQLYQRSADIFLGLPFNIASYSLLTMMIAQVCDLGVGEFIHTIGDAHIYKDHLKQVDIQLDRDQFQLPTMKINSNVKSIFDFKYEDFELQNYQCHPAIVAPISV